MKIIFFLLTMFASCYQVVFGRDFNVNTAGDSLYAKSTIENNEFGSPNSLNGNTDLTLISVGRRTSVMKGADTVLIPPKNIAVSSYKEHMMFPFRFHAGYSYRLAKVYEQPDPAFEDYLKKLKSGFVVGADFHGFISEIFALGVKYNLNKYMANKGSNFKDNITMHYVAGSLLCRLPSADQKNHLLLGLNVGYQTYKSKSKYYTFDINSEGGTVGYGFEAGFDHKIDDKKMLNFSLNVMGATLTKMKTNNGTKRKLSKDEYEKLARLELTVGLTFGK